MSSVRVVAEFPCLGDSSAMTLTIIKSPAAYAGPNATICDASTYTLSASTAANYNILTWSTSGNGSFDDTQVLHPVYTPGSTDKSNGTVTLMLSLTGNTPCPDAISNMVLTITPSIIADNLSAASSVPELPIHSPGVTASNYSTINWTTSGTGTFSNPGILNPVYTPSSADIVAHKCHTHIESYRKRSLFRHYNDR